MFPLLNQHNQHLAGDALPPLSTDSKKKRKPNVSGTRKTSHVLLNFNILYEEPKPIIAGKQHHKRYRCESKTHGTYNMLPHSKVCHKILIFY